MTETDRRMSRQARAIRKLIRTVIDLRKRVEELESGGGQHDTPDDNPD